MKKALNGLLLVSFLITILVPMTGVPIHKLTSTLFLLLCMVHTLVYRRNLGVKRWLLLALVISSFITGLFGMIWEQLPLILMLHRVISIAIVFFLAIHIFVFHKKFLP